jgi:DNA-binding transcriptional ArsR family regulator
MKPRRDVFQAIADPTRRAIIFLLTAGALTPNAIAEEFNNSRQAVSKHLQILTECNILKQERQGREILYHLNADKINEVENWLVQFRELLSKRFDQLDTVIQKLKNNRK